MAASRIIEAVVAHAESRASLLGYRIGPQALSLIRMRVEAGTVGTRRTRTAEDQTIRDFKANVDRLIVLMIDGRHAIPGYAKERPGIIGERTFDYALGIICPPPAYPFCK